jgi:Rod binding domain-containing protein
MATSMPTAVPSPAATAALASLNPKTLTGKAAKTQAAAQDFEQVFVNSMFQQMFSGLGQGPFNGGPGAAVWRSFLTDEYAKSFVKNGGIGIADQVQRELLAHQEAS